MGSLDHIEEHTTVCDVDGGTPQLLVEARVVKQIKILKHQQAERLVIGVQRHL